MTIKDVEKLTGLTAKSIRYYEGKGLLTVERNEENDYRSYTETEVNRLKKIKLLRYLDFSVEEVKAMLDLPEDEVIEKLMKKSEGFLEESERCMDKRNLCLTLAKDYKKNTENQDKMIDEYNETIDFMESDEMAELEEQLGVAGSPSFSLTIVQTLIYLGPILWLFINISDGKLDGLLWNAVFALVGTILLTGTWIFYIMQRLKYKNHVKKKNRQTAWVIPVMIVTIILGIVVFVSLCMMTEKLLAPENFLFYEHHPIAGTCMIWLSMLFVILMALLVLAKITKKSKKEMNEMNEILFLWNALGKFKLLVVVAWVVAIYCCMTSVTFVTEDTIVYHSPIQPWGVEYSYTDVDKITTGFGNSNFAFVEYKKKGNFYYQLEVDGKTITFHQPTTNEAIDRYTEDTYLELEEFDQRMVELGIPKEGDSHGYENCSFDQRYIDRFVRITELK